MVTSPTVDTAGWAQSIEHHLVRAAPLIACIGLTSGATLSALFWHPNLAITASRALPAQQAYTAVVGGSQTLAAQLVRRDAAIDIAIMTLVGTGPTTSVPNGAPPRPGDIVLVLESGSNGAPGGKLSVVLDQDLTLDSPPDYLAQGGPVLNATGALVGLCVSSAEGAPRLVPLTAIGGAITGSPRQGVQRRGWIGASLQPVNLPPAIRAAAQQRTGRLLLDVVPGGPAELGGLRGGDVLLSIGGHRMNGHGSLRSALGEERIGQPAHVSILRDGRIMTATVTIMPAPA